MVGSQAIPPGQIGVKTASRFLVLVALAGCAAPTYQPVPLDPEPTVQTRTGIPLQQEYCVVSGEVRRPGPIPLSGKITLSYAIETALGFTDAADPKRLEVRRSDGSIEQYDYDRIIRSSASMPHLGAGDSLEVKRKRASLW